MSDTPQGPGWWQASDDRWYPPESHPGANPGGASAARSGPSERPKWLLPAVAVAAVAALVVAGLVVALGGDSDGSASGDQVEFCELYLETDSASEPPSRAEMDRLDALVPEEIADEMHTLTDYYREAESLGRQPDDPSEAELRTAADEARDWTEANCGDHDPGGETDRSSDTDDLGGINSDPADGRCDEDRFIQDPDC
jgi:hypothetical protein